MKIGKVVITMINLFITINIKYRMMYYRIKKHSTMCVIF